MKLNRLIWIGLTTTVVGIVVSVFLLIRADRPLPATVNGDAVMQAIHAFCLDRQARHQPLPASLALGQLVDAGFLRESDLGSVGVREYIVYLDPKSGFVIMHFPHP